MTITELIKNLPDATLVGNGDTEIRGLNYDSRRIQHGDLFCALVGETSDGNAFITKALGNGAVAVLTDQGDAVPEGCTAIVVPNARIAMANAAHQLFDNPTQSLLLTGITGTNGKTTCSYVMQSILDAAGRKTGRVGTTGWDFAGEGAPLERTTPEAPDMLKLLVNMRERGADAAVLEVTSIAMPMHRVEGFQFDAGLFTNLSQDHLDLHGSMEEYLAAKKLFFEMLPPNGVAVANADDPVGLQMLDGIAAKAFTFGFNTDADFRGELISESADGMTIRVKYKGESFDLVTPYIGRFNASNVLGCIAIALALGMDRDLICEGVKLAPQVRGRMERLQLEGGITAVVDYAHTPDALERALEALRPMTRAKLIVVVGAGGNRDAIKRPIMGRVASEGADLVLITSDNPRFEDPDMIVRQISEGSDKSAMVVVNRRKALETALDLAEVGDVILVAGKGHETYQDIEGVKHPFDDRAELLNLRGLAC
jgi:UDP-N-acetylmuramoyl-L-alanyl-D-glutamate--2,6-diaminopimelate ligase